MLNRIIRFSIRNKLIVALFILAWISWGAFEFTRLPMDALPDITSNQVQAITVTPTLASPEVEQLITFPIEQACSNIPGITEIRSISRFGLSVVTIVFRDETDIYWARQQVGERLAQIRQEIPPEAGSPALAPATTGLGEVYQYILRPAAGYEGKYTIEDLRTIQDWIVRRQLLGTPGVADVSSFGGKLRQYEVALRPERLQSLGISMSDVYRALEQNNQNAGGSYIEQGPSLLYIRAEGQARNMEDIRRIPVRQTASGIPIFIRDIAEVRIGHAVRYGALTYEDKGEVAGAVVLMLKGENAVQVIAGIQARIERIRQTLPEGVELVTFLDRTKMVGRAVSTVSQNLLEGALIVVFVLVFFLGNLRAGLLVASVIPLSMLFSITLMNLTGVSGNLMSLGAIDFGLIVDGAVIIVEAILHRLHLEKMKGGIRQPTDTMDAIVSSTSSRMMNAAVFGQIIILVVYLPILSLSGIEGKMFRPMAQTVAFALLGALILSLTYVPMMSSWLLSHSAGHSLKFSERFMQWLGHAYAKTLAATLRRPKFLLGVSLFTLCLSFGLATRLGGEFIPELEEGDFAIDARIITGSSLSESVRVATAAATILRGFPEVERIVTRIGASEIPTDPMPIEMTDIIVSLRDKKTWTTSETYDALADTMSRALHAIPGLTAGFQYPVQMRFNELTAGARQDVVCKIFGEDLDTLASLAQMLAASALKLEGVRDLYVEAVTGLPQVVIRYRRDQMSMFGVSIKEVNRTVRAAFAGETVGKIYENERRYDLVVRLDASARKGIEDIRRMLVTTISGRQVALYQLADIFTEEGPNQIQREDAKRRIIVAFNTRGRDVQSIVEDLQRRVAVDVKLPAGYYVQYGGQFENLMEARQRLVIAVPVALLLIFVMLYFAFHSIQYGLLIFSAIPLSAIGGILSLWLRDMPFSISAGVGFIALFGVAVINGIVLLSEFKRLMMEVGLSAEEAVAEGTQNRLRPVLMTAAVASLGFLPMALSQSAGTEVQRPLATVVIGGLVTATLLTLFVLPALFLYVQRRSAGFRGPLATASLLALCLSPGLAAQPLQGIQSSTTELLQIAERRSLSVANTRSMDAYWQALASKVFDPPRTQLGLEYGNLNSFNLDTRFFTSQSFQPPVVYARNRDYFQAGLLSNQALTRLRLRDVRYQVRSLCAALASLQERDLLLRRLDTVYNRSARAAALRLQTGETGRLAKASAEAYAGHVRLQRRQLLEDLVQLQQRLATVLDTAVAWLPLPEEPLPETKATSPALQITSHPQLDLLQSQQDVKKAQTEIEKNKLAPEFNLGYSNLSIIGWQSPDGLTQKFYGATDRFGQIQFSMGLPIFTGAARARIRAGNVEAAIAAQERERTRKDLSGRLAEAMANLRKHSASLEWFQQTGLEEAQVLESDAAAGLAVGSLSYAEWAVLMDQAVRIRLEWLQARDEVRKANAEIEYITGKD
ncbi:MAG: CusA/CzcA family heavy metal efflux RND transporter [Bacteroidetes bacterium]|nr:CusA/CzcA family heavy metal efflux RND transporter [Bacteroidota bacterium]